MIATYNSVWDGGTVISTLCNYDLKTKIVTDIEKANVENWDFEICDDEYITLPGDDETEIRDFINPDMEEDEDDG